MKCRKCKNKAYHTDLCSPCFCRMIGGRVRKDFRLNMLFKKDDIVFVKDPLCEYFIRTVFKSMPLKLVKSGRHDKKVILWTMDDEIEHFLDRFMNKKELKGIGHDSKEIKLFRTVKDDELEAYAKANNIKFKRKKRIFGQLIDDIEKKHAETRFSLLKSIDKLSEILRK